MKLRARQWWWLPVTLVLLMGAFMLFTHEVRAVPQEFEAARLEGARLAEEIVAAANFSLENLEKIGELDRKGKTSDALILISEELKKNNEIHDKAIALASQLERMAILIPEVQPTRARSVATEALSAEVGLVGHLVTYSAYFSQLFEILRTKFVNKKTNVDGEVTALIDKINEEASAINNLNTKFTSGLAEFDTIFAH